MVETYRYRVQRYWLRGPRAGKVELFVEGLPGFPDGISTGSKGRYWMALYTVRNKAADWLSPRPNAKRLLAKLPRFMWPKPAPYGLVLALDGGGRIIESRHDSRGSNIINVTSVEEHGGSLYLGGLHSPFMARCTL